MGRNTTLCPRKKSYAMHRMIIALGRAIDTQSIPRKDRAARWAAAWGLMAGIESKGVRLRHSSLPTNVRNERRKAHR
jgi:hypothetical protein